MKAVTYQVKDHMEVKEVEAPSIQKDTDMIVKITASGICGSDLHLYKGGIPAPQDYIVGHEPMGIVEFLRSNNQELPLITLATQSPSTAKPNIVIFLADDEGYGEQDDVRAGLNYLAEKYPGQEITLCGFSFGARVGMEVGLADERVVRLISIGTPVDRYDFSFLEQCRKPILFVHGENDEYGEVNRLREIVERIAAQAPAELRVIKGAGHFFDNRLDELKRVIAEWVNAQQAGS